MSEKIRRRKRETTEYFVDTEEGEKRQLKSVKTFRLEGKDEQDGEWIVIDYEITW